MPVLHSKISTKGRLVIPAEFRKALKLNPGTRILMQREGHSLLLYPVTDAFIESIPGSLGGPSLGALRERQHR